MGNTTRPVVVVDGQEARRHDLAAKLRDRAMEPLTPRTPLEVVDLLARTERRVEVCLIGSRFHEHAGREMASALRDSFPWIKVVLVEDDDDDAAAVDGAEAAWNAALA